MEASNDIMIRISPNEGKITVEEDAQGVFSRKSITEEDLLRCFKDSLRTADEGYHSGFLPLNTISLYQSETVLRDGLLLRSTLPQRKGKALDHGQCQGRILFAQLPDGVNGFLHGGRLNILLVKELRQAHIEIIRDIK